MNKWLSWVLKIAFTAGVFGYLFTKIDFADVWRQAAGMDLGMAALSLLVLFVQYPISARRWHAVLRALAAPVGFGRVFLIYYIGCFFNLTLPSSVGGDAVRMWMARRGGLTVAASINSVILERVATVFGLVLLVAATQPLLLRRVPELPGTWVFPLLTVLSALGILALTMLDRVPSRFGHWRLVRGLAAVARDARHLFLRSGNALGVLFWVLLGHANLSFTVYLLALALDIDVGVVDCMVLVPPVILFTTLPISISGWGVREGAMVVAFGFVGVADHAALALSLLWGLSIILTSLPGGIMWLMSGGKAAAADLPG